jgi:hypothetical protein
MAGPTDLGRSNIPAEDGFIVVANHGCSTESVPGTRRIIVVDNNSTDATVSGLVSPSVAATADSSKCQRAETPSCQVQKPEKHPRSVARPLATSRRSRRQIDDDAWVIRLKRPSSRHVAGAPPACWTTSLTGLHDSRTQIDVHNRLRRSAVRFVRRPYLRQRVHHRLRIDCLQTVFRRWQWCALAGRRAISHD